MFKIVITQTIEEEYQEDPNWQVVGEEPLSDDHIRDIRLAERFLPNILGERAWMVDLIALTSRNEFVTENKPWVSGNVHRDPDQED